MSEIWEDLRSEHRETIEQIAKIFKARDLKVFITGESNQTGNYNTIELVANSKYGSGPNDFEKSITEITLYLIEKNPNASQPKSIRSNSNFAIIYEYNLKSTNLGIYLQVSYNPNA